MKFDARAKRGQQSHSQNKCFSRVAHNFFSTEGSKNALYDPSVGGQIIFLVAYDFFLLTSQNWIFCPAGGNKMHFMTL